MKVPGAELAVVDQAKVRDYLLSPEHPVGRFKAVFFGGLGYSRDDWQILAANLRAIVASEDVTPGDQSPFGVKYEVHGTLVGRNGRDAEVMTVWISLEGRTRAKVRDSFSRVI